ncbi:hypothetical protein KVR01_007913 [Diaporthe batatas]|uniref:uncharacterized protein n=1 Tax=Diaporthe batatas TaxID=748121 RepID=UPI001D04CF43|nr:uncharacterized protein KVR01_007913 [Diaporthe batatas]KAG8162148.1 hypothetical protein KVR01_007913 [Diaporthe batatas]
MMAKSSAIQETVYLVEQYENQPTYEIKGVDKAVDLVAGRDTEPLDPAEAKRIRNKIDRVVLPLLFSVYILQFLDKSTIGASSVLGLISDNKLTADEFNTLGSAFYIGISLIIGVLFWWLFPDSPMKARFLTTDEKIKVIQRIRSNQSGIETKVWKREQFVEAVRDPKTWLFFFLAAIS